MIIGQGQGKFSLGLARHLVTSLHPICKGWKKVEKERKKKLYNFGLLLLLAGRPAY